MARGAVLMRRALGCAGLVVSLGACPSGAGEGAVGSGASNTASAASPSGGATDRDPNAAPSGSNGKAGLAAELGQRARVGLARCAWTDDAGFDEGCKVLDEFAEEPSHGSASGAAAIELMHDADARVRRLGLMLWSTAEKDATTAAKVALVEAALAEKVAALDLRLAYAAARLPGKNTELRRPFEALVRNTSTATRVTVLLFMHTAEDDPAWLLELTDEALRDPDPAVRAAAVLGLGGRASFAAAATCQTWVRALKDPNFEVRNRARKCIFGSVDIWHEDPVRGLIAGRANPQSKPCAEPDLGAAFDSAALDRKSHALSDEADADLWASASYRQLPEPRAAEATRALVAIATDAHKPRAARVRAISALRRRRDANKTVLETLAKDADPVIAKAAVAKE